MNWITVLIVAVVITVFFMVKSAGQIPVKEAQAHWQKGALLIDVRTPGEFNSGHLAKAVNIPLDDIETVLPQRVKDKSQVLLLHCASGMRSGVAQRKLKSLGYTNAVNLGSYNRAKSVVGE